MCCLGCQCGASSVVSGAFPDDDGVAPHRRAGSKVAAFVGRELPGPLDEGSEAWNMDTGHKDHLS